MSARLYCTHCRAAEDAPQKCPRCRESFEKYRFGLDWLGDHDIAESSIFSFLPDTTASRPDAVPDAGSDGSDRTAGPQPDREGTERRGSETFDFDVDLPPGGVTDPAGTEPLEDPDAGGSPS